MYFCKYGNKGAGEPEQGKNCPNEAQSNHSKSPLENFGPRVYNSDEFEYDEEIPKKNHPKARKSDEDGDEEEEDEREYERGREEEKKKSEVRKRAKKAVQSSRQSSNDGPGNERQAGMSHQAVFMNLEAFGTEDDEDKQKKKKNGRKVDNEARKNNRQNESNAAGNWGKAGMCPQAVFMNLEAFGTEDDGGCGVEQKETRKAKKISNPTRQNSGGEAGGSDNDDGRIRSEESLNEEEPMVIYQPSHINLDFLISSSSDCIAAGEWEDGPLKFRSTPQKRMRGSDHDSDFGWEEEEDEYYDKYAHMFDDSEEEETKKKKSEVAKVTGKAVQNSNDGPGNEKQSGMSHQAVFMNLEAFYTEDDEDKQKKKKKKNSRKVDNEARKNNHQNESNAAGNWGRAGMCHQAVFMNLERFGTEDDEDKQKITSPWINARQKRCLQPQKNWGSSGDSLTETAATEVFSSFSLYSTIE